MKTIHPPGSIWYNCYNNTTLRMSEGGEWEVIYPPQPLRTVKKETLREKAARLFRKLIWKE